MKKPNIICGFPGVGKSHLFTTKDKNVKLTDSDSSKFDKKEFPSNYIEHIKKKIDEGYTVLCSTHTEVREALVQEGLDFYLVYPSLSCKKEYVTRYEERGSPKQFVEMMDKNFMRFVLECDLQDNCVKICLEPGEFIPPLGSSRYDIE